jgi:murein DD-endopeptidase MepM/ murein hydrolase activator NlpD
VAATQNMMTPGQNPDANEQGMIEVLEKKLPGILKIFEKITEQTKKQFNYTQKTMGNFNGGDAGGGKLGLGSFGLSRGQVALGMGVMAGASYMSMAPNTMSAVTQRMSADSMSGRMNSAGMTSRSIIAQSNKLVAGGATSAMGPTMAAMNLSYQGGYSVSSLSSKNVMASLGGLSALTGGSNEQVASTMAGMNGMGFLRAGINIRDSKGQLLPIPQIVNQVYKVLYGGRTPTADQANMLLNPNSKGWKTLMMITGGDANLSQTIAMAVRDRAANGKDLANNAYSSAQGTLDRMGVSKDAPTRANFRFNSSENKVLQATEKGLVGGYNASLNTAAGLNNGFAQLASLLGPVNDGLMTLKGILQTFPNAGNMGGTVSGLTAMGSNLAGSALQYGMMSKAFGGGAAGSGALAATEEAAVVGGSMMSRLKGGFGKVGSNLFKGGLGKLFKGGLISLGGNLVGDVVKGHSAKGSGRSRAGNALKTGASWAAMASLFAPETFGLSTAIAGIAGGIYGAFQGGPNDGMTLSNPSDSKSQASGSATMALPVPKGTPITSPFGHRKGGQGISSNHQGIDYGVAENTNITAAADGVVTEVGNGGGYGNYIIIKHGNKSTLYAHLNTALVSKGQSVKKGTVIAKSGGKKGAPGAGHSTGPHLHFELRDNGGRGAGGRVNPSNWFGKTAGWIGNLASKAFGFVKSVLTGHDPFASHSGSVLSHNNNPQFKGLSDLSSPGISGLLSQNVSRGRPIGWEDIVNKVGAKNIAKLKGNPNSVGDVYTPADGDAGHMVGGSRKGLMKMLYAQGFRGAGLETAFAVALAESGGVSRRNYSLKTGDDSYGAFQINMLGSLGPARRKKFGLSKDSDLLDGKTNLRVAYTMSHEGNNFKAWSTYKNGKFASYLDDAYKTEKAAGIGGGTQAVGVGSMPEHNMSHGRSGGGAHLSANTNIEVKVNMQVHIERSSFQEADKMFKQFAHRIETDLRHHIGGTY